MRCQVKSESGVKLDVGLGNEIIFFHYRSAAQALAVVACVTDQ
jgi:hypothetical protein